MRTFSSFYCLSIFLPVCLAVMCLFTYLSITTLLWTVWFDFLLCKFLRYRSENRGGFLNHISSRSMRRPPRTISHHQINITVETHLDMNIIWSFGCSLHIVFCSARNQESPIEMCGLIHRKHYYNRNDSP